MSSLFRSLTVASAFIASLALSPAARADVALLIHGYLGDANSWRAAGVEPVLDAAGWRKRGVWLATPQGTQLFGEVASDVPSSTTPSACLPRHRS